MMLVCAMFAICWIAYIQWETTIASFTQSINISMSQYSVLWTINGIMILVAQPLIRPIIILLKGNLKHQMFVGILIFYEFFPSDEFCKSLCYICSWHGHFNFWRNVCLACSTNYSKSTCTSWKARAIPRIC